jgi:hypothetical protein
MDNLNKKLDDLELKILSNSKRLDFLEKTFETFTQNKNEKKNIVSNETKLEKKFKKLVHVIFHITNFIN